METKVCRTCGEAVPLDGYYTSRGKPRPDCKSCTRKGQQEKRDRLKQRSPEEAITKTEKRCSKCNEVLPVSMFGLALINPDGLKSYCKPCESTISTDWLYAKEERRERYRFNTRQRRKADPEKFLAPLRLWRKNNPERHREIQQRSPCRCALMPSEPKTRLLLKSANTGKTCRAGNAVTGASDHACPTSSCFWRLVLLPARRLPTLA